MEIKIGKSGRVCLSCERTFEHEEQLRSVVRIGEEGLTRHDYCTKCYNAELGTNAYSVWSPKYYDPAVAEALPEEVFSPLRQAFYDAVDSKDRNTLAMAFLAAQLLRRQKVFRLLKETEDGDEEMKLILFADRIGDRLIEVKDPFLSHAEMEEGRVLLMERLAELESPDELPTEDDGQGDTVVEETSDGYCEEEISVDE